MSDANLIRRIAHLSDLGDLNHLVHDLVKAARDAVESDYFDEIEDGGPKSRLRAVLKHFEGG